MKKITKIEIQNSEFFTEGFKLDFSENLNCIMGGRGTGKSTLLHFIKACIELDAEEDKNTFSMLKNNLESGLIKLYMQADNGDKYSIEKSFGEEPQPYLLSSGRHVPLENIKKELICDIFPAQVIEEIGRNGEARLELIDKMLIGEIDELKGKIEMLQIELEKNAKDIRSQNQKLKKAKEQLQDYASAEEDLKNHKAEQPPDVKETERKEFEKQDAAEKIRGAEKRFLKNLSDRLTRLRERCKETSEEVDGAKSLANNTEKFINKMVIDPLAKEVQRVLTEILTRNASTEQQITNTIKKIDEALEQLKTLHEQQHNEFVQLKQKLEKHKNFYDKLNALSKRVDERNVRLNDIEELTEKRKKLKTQREKNINALNDLKRQILDKRLGMVNELNTMFDGKIKITLTPGGITNEYEDALRNALKGHNMRYNTIVPYIVGNFSPDKLARVIHDSNVEKLKEVSGIDKERSQAVLEALYETDAIYDIETIYCPDLPDFHLKVDKEGDSTIKKKENYKKSDELSTGQRCTTVLPIVFAISKNPLIIDQPEDNLDNKYISDTIHKIIREQKKDRQLIFITHNANIPVLSGAEKNVFLKYSAKKSQIDSEGSVEEVKDSILKLLEGGEDAFKQRKNLYGF